MTQMNGVPAQTDPKFPPPEPANDGDGYPRPVTLEKFLERGDWIAANEEHEQNGAGAAPSPAPPPPTSSAEQSWLSLVQRVTSDWLTNEPPARKYLLSDSRTGKGALPLGKVGQFIAEGGAGKTMALIDLAFAVATGSRWLGYLSVSTPGRVLLLLGEEDVDETKRRIFHVASARDGKPPDGSIIVLPLAGVVCPMIRRDPKTGDWHDTEFLKWVRDGISQSSLQLIIVDPLSRFAGADAEKDNAGATRFVQAMESLAGAGATVLFAHHTNQVSRGAAGQVGATSSRGVTALVDGARWQISLKTESLKDANGERLEIATLENSKSNYSQKFDPIVLRRGPYGLLCPVTPEEMAMIEETRKVGNPRVQAALGVEEARKHITNQRDQEHAAKRAKKVAEAQHEEAKRCAQEDAALDAILATTPNLGKRELRAAMREALGSCSSDRADTAMARRQKRTP